VQKSPSLKGVAWQKDYIVEFDDGNEAELNANLIAEAMYARCDPDGHQYVLLDSLGDHRHLDMAIQPADQKVSDLTVVPI